MTEVVVEAGICGFTATVKVTKLSNRKLGVVIASDCEILGELGNELQELDWPDALRSPGNTIVYESAFRHIKHTACTIPVAILKAIEVEVGAALPKDVSIRFQTAK